MGPHVRFFYDLFAGMANITEGHPASVEVTKFGRRNVPAIRGTTNWYEIAAFPYSVDYGLASKYSGQINKERVKSGKKKGDVSVNNTDPDTDRLKMLMRRGAWEEASAELSKVIKIKRDGGMSLGQARTSLRSALYNNRPLRVPKEELRTILMTKIPKTDLARVTKAQYDYLRHLDQMLPVSSR